MAAAWADDDILEVMTLSAVDADARRVQILGWGADLRGEEEVQLHNVNNL